MCSSSSKFGFGVDCSSGGVVEVMPGVGGIAAGALSLGMIFRSLVERSVLILVKPMIGERRGVVVQTSDLESSLFNSRMTIGQSLTRLLCDWLLLNLGRVDWLWRSARCSWDSWRLCGLHSTVHGSRRL
jgi:hypothetical protein